MAFATVLEEAGQTGKIQKNLKTFAQIDTAHLTWLEIHISTNSIEALRDHPKKEKIQEKGIIFSRTQNLTGVIEVKNTCFSY
ncbi:hypothetical protein MUK42_35342 [Musa troglodytarum]|uniref:Uncharacterized protein n=1 Tax=Musa troglodytarum TaxID=320322 RepID=A0A9E7EDS2_9LILI|nr:hypothetical protein MUK42_35342 [Musa troglodytarum]